MEGLQKSIRGAVSKNSTATTTTSAANIPSPSFNAVSTYASSSSSSSDPSSLLLTRPPRQAVSLLTCSKLCAFCFVAGIVVGYTLKQRVRRWASRLLRRIKDDS